MALVLDLTAVVLGLAVVARLRLWYYNRRNLLQCAEEESAHARCDGLRSECNRLWWEGQR